MTNTLISKIASASKKVGALATDKRNTQQGYDYISADKVLERAGNALAEAGVVIVPSIVSEVTEAVKTDKGGTRYDSVVHFGMILSDGESQLEMPWCGRGSDYSVPDKAMYKAVTSGHKYFLMKLLNVGVGNEDGEHENDGQAAEDAQKAAPKQAAKPVATPTSKPRATVEQVQQLDALGNEFYGENEWPQHRIRLANVASKGAVNHPTELMESEIAKLLSGLTKELAGKMAQVNVATAEAIPH